MQSETIDTHEAIRLFREFMQPASDLRVIHLVGDAKMGKTHLLAKIFPIQAVQDHQARYALLDLRNPMTIPDILQFLCISLGKAHFDRYQAAHQQWSTKPKVSIQGMTAIASSVSIVAKDTEEDRRARDREFTNQFVEDLSRLNDSPLLLLLDHFTPVESFSKAKKEMQIWLMETLVALITQYAHVRVIIAGRTLPDAPSSYAACCQSVRLRAVKDVEEYITFCKKSNVTLEEQSIRDFALAVDYTPGLFADLPYK